MEFKIFYTKEAENDLDEIYRYIAFELFVPNTARSLIKKILDKIENLRYMPLAYKKYQKEPWLSRGLRYLVVGNYLVFYIPNEEKEAVTIIRIMYGGRDIENHL